jgi:hypothetical protein
MGVMAGSQHGLDGSQEKAIQSQKGTVTVTVIVMVIVMVIHPSWKEKFGQSGQHG